MATRQTRSHRWEYAIVFVARGAGSSDVERAFPEFCRMYFSGSGGRPKGKRRGAKVESEVTPRFLDKLGA